MDRALGCDVSFWDTKVDFSKMLANGAAFCYIKASQLTQDNKFSTFWQDAKKAGLPRGAYHYLDWRMSELTQAKLFVEAMAGDWGELPPVCDFEMRTGAPDPGVMRGKLWNFLQYVEKATGRIPMIYTGYYYWTEFGTPDVGWLKYPLWLAWYADESVIKVPKPWGAWKFWQYSDRGDGHAFGCESAGLDMSWFSGTVRELLEFANQNPKPQPEPLTLESLDRRVKALEEKLNA
jgi:lysozyme